MRRDHLRAVVGLYLFRNPCLRDKANSVTAEACKWQRPVPRICTLNKNNRAKYASNNPYKTLVPTSPVSLNSPNTAYPAYSLFYNAYASSISINEKRVWRTDTARHTLEILRQDSWFRQSAFTDERLTSTRLLESLRVTVLAFTLPSRAVRGT